jgi:cytochrome c553
MKVALAAVFAAVTLASAVAQAAAEAPPGALACGGCHAAAAAGVMPELAGRPADAIVAALLGYRRGTGLGSVMERIARGFSEDEIRAIADWLAARGGATPARP